MAIRKLTAAFVRDVAPGTKREIYWDASLPGFGLMVTERGHRSFVVQYRSGDVSRRFTIKALLGLEGARREALADREVVGPAVGRVGALLSASGPRGVRGGGQGGGGGGGSFGDDPGRERQDNRRWAPPVLGRRTQGCGRIGSPQV